MSTEPVIQRALLSTADKSGLVGFASALSHRGIELIATGGTAKLLQDHQLPLTEVADYTGFPEILNGRVKTLHPKIHGGVLARRGTDDTELQQQAIPTIDLVIVNLYPFAETIAKPNCSFADAIENIDIGGPTLLRAAAKNHESVTVLSDPADYPIVIDEIERTGNTTLATRRRLAQKVFAFIAQYDQLIAQYLATNSEQDLPTDLNLQYQQQQALRYGENPQQSAGLYRPVAELTGKEDGTLAAATLLQGKPLSFNNLLDSDAALSCVQALDPAHASCVIVKHATPCGVAQSDDSLQAYQQALATDPTSAFGGIIALNQPLELDVADFMLKQQFIEVLLAPQVSEAAAARLQEKPQLRVLIYGKPKQTTARVTELRTISGGLLAQQSDIDTIEQNDLTIVTRRQPTNSEMADLLFAWRVVRFVKSNAIVYAKNQATLGLGGGQTSRVFSAEIAALKAKQAGLDLTGSVMASDAFFPFADGLETAVAAGITAVIQPGGSKRDSEVIAAADNAGIAMVLTGQRHFRH